MIIDRYLALLLVLSGHCYSIILKVLTGISKIEKKSPNDMELKMKNPML
jgi:hypothetical protein